MRAGWLTPDSLPTVLRHCTISFPDSEEFHSLVRGALFLLSDEANWEEFGSLTVTQTADVFRDVLVRFFGDDCMQLPVGTILEFAGVSLPAGFLWCEGQAISRTTYAELWNKVGEAYGIGDGSTTFNLPNRKGRVGLGEDIDIGPEFERGYSGGEITHTLTKQEIPDDLDYYYNVGGSVSSHALPFSSTGVLASGFINPSGGNPHNNMPPYAVLKYIIKY